MKNLANEEEVALYGKEDGWAGMFALFLIVVGVIWGIRNSGPQFFQHKFLISFYGGCWVWLVGYIHVQQETKKGLDRMVGDVIYKANQRALRFKQARFQDRLVAEILAHQWVEMWLREPKAHLGYTGLEIKLAFAYALSHMARKMNEVCDKANKSYADYGNDSDEYQVAQDAVKEAKAAYRRLADAARDLYGMADRSSWRDDLPPDLLDEEGGEASQAA